MKPSEIISQVVAQKGLDPVATLHALDLIIKAHKGFILQHNNSVLFCLYIKQNDIETHLFSLDTPLGIASAIKYFINRIKASHIHAVYGDESNPKIVELLKIYHLHVLPSDISGLHWKVIV